MKYLGLICIMLFMVCIGTVKAFKAIKIRKTSSEPLNKSFAVSLIFGIPCLIVSIYYAVAEPSSYLLLIGTAVICGIVSFILYKLKII